MEVSVLNIKGQETGKKVVSSELNLMTTLFTLP